MFSDVQTINQDNINLGFTKKSIIYYNWSIDPFQDLPIAARGGNPVSKTVPESKCPELLANYCDMLLRKTPLSKVVTPVLGLTNDFNYFSV